MARTHKRQQQSPTLSLPNSRTNLPIPPIRLRVMPLPRLPPPRRRLIELVPLPQPPRLLPRGSQPARLAVLVDRLHDPVDACVAADGLVLRVHEDDLEVLVRRVLVDPVGVEDAEVGAAAADALFGGGFEGALVFELVDALVCGLAYWGGVGETKGLVVFLGWLERGGEQGGRGRQ